MSAPVLAVVKTFCTSLPSFSPRVFMKVSSAIMRQTDKLRRGKRESVAAEPNRCDQIIRFRNPGNEDAQVAGEADRHGCDGARLNDKKNVQP